MKLRVFSADFAILLLALSAVPAVLFFTQTSTEPHIFHLSVIGQAASLPSNRPFDYILIILTENKNFNQR